jgi:exosortase
VLFAKLTEVKSLVNVAVMLKVLVVLSVILLFYGQDLVSIFSDAFQNEAANYVLLVPVVFGYFLYRKRKMLKAVVVSEESTRNSTFLVTLSGILLCTTAVMLYWYGTETFSPLEYRVITLPIFAAGLVLVLFNLQTLRQLAFPIFFLVFLVPPSSQILNGVGSALSVMASEASARIVNFLGIHAEILSQYGNPAIMITRADKTVFGFTLDLSCSGVYPLLAFLIFGFFMAYITRGAAWKKAVIFFVGFPLVYSLNIVRITSILLIGFGYGQDLALQAFHLLSGLVLIVLSIVFLFAVMEKLFGARIFRGSISTQACAKCVSPGNARENYCTYCGKSLKNARILIRRRDVTRILIVALFVALFIGIQTPALAQANKPLSVFVQAQNGELGNTRILDRKSVV